MRFSCNILVGRPEGKHHLEDPGLDGLIILKRTLKIWYIDVLYKSNLAQNRDHLWALVNKVMTFLVLNYVGNFLTR
jgi:hypothetical protein